jgi:cephalosporin hydroxylase
MILSTNTLESTCFVIGNGPSLRGFDFRRLKGASTLGMNAAYRYWREIDWYPDYYACLDDELIATHWRQIIALVREGKVKKAFVSGSIHQYDSSIAGDERFVFLDQFISYWFRQRAKSFGVPFIDSPYFQSTRSDKITTGSHSVRFAAHLGFKKICLLGIDLKYVEKIPEAEQVGEIALRIRDTPKHNPNYFFDGYQRAGDRYNIPNPSEHDGDLHFASLKAVRDDFAKVPTSARIINCNAHSRLFEERIFPYQHVDRALNDRPLSAVVVPTILKERDTLLNQLWLFEQKDFAPEPSGKFLKPALTYVFNSGDSRLLEDEIRAQFEASARLKEAFEAPTFQNIGLSGEQDQYIRDYSKPAGRFGYKAGPNNQFFETLARHAGSTHYLFLMETDCLPIRAGWLNQLQNQLHDAEPFWILGSAYRGRTTLGESYKRHINGNAVYAAGDAVFQHFIETFWRPELDRVIRANPRVAYDCALEILMGEALSEDPDNPTWRITQELLHLIRYTDMIQNRSGGRDSWDTPPDLPAQLYREDPVAYFLHGKPFADGLANMRKAGAADIRKWKVPRDETFTIPGTNVLAPAIKHSDEYPRILLIDHTLIGDKSATGELKASLFSEWPKSQYMQIHGGNTSVVGFSRVAGNTSVDVSRLDQRIWLKTKIDDYKPEMIFYRPVPDTMPLHDFAMEVIHDYDVPLVSWIMDDWPKSLEGRDKAQFEKLDQDWRKLLMESAGALSIGESMSRAFEKRYRTKFQAFANAIDPTQWSGQAPAARTEILVRYSGSLSPNMGVESIFQVAQAVETLAQEGVDIRFEIKTRQHWLDAAGARFNTLTRTTITTKDLSAEGYRVWLSGADIVLIAYNFDEASKDYVRYSIANKLPECLASGAALLAIGPPDIASIQLLDSLKCSVTVKSQSAAEVLVALRDLSSSRENRQTLALRAREIAATRFDIRKVRGEFMTWIRDTLRTSSVNLSLKITRNAERRRWALRHADSQTAAPKAADPLTTPPAVPSPAASASVVSTPKLSASYDPDAFIRPGQISAKPAAPTFQPLPTLVSAASAAISVSRLTGGSAPTAKEGNSMKPLTIFPIGAANTGLQQSPTVINGAAGDVVAPLAGPARADSFPPLGVPPENAPELPPAAQSPMRPVIELGSQKTPVPPESSVFARLLDTAGQAARDRRVIVAGGVFLMLLLVAVVAIVPAQLEVRILIGAVGALFFCLAAGGYFAYRTRGFARRTAAENAEMKAKLDLTAARLAAFEREARTSAAQQSATLTAVAQRIERHATTNFAATEARIAELAAQAAQSAGTIGELKERQAYALREHAAGNNALSARIDDALQAQSIESSRLSLMLDAVSERLADLHALQTGDASRVSDAIDGVSVQVSELEGRVDGEAARADDTRVRLLETREALDALHSMALENISSVGDRLSTMRETAFLDAENRRQIEERVALLEDTADETRASLSHAVEAVKADADAVRKTIGRVDAHVSEESIRLADLASRVASADDFAKQVAYDLHVADKEIRETLTDIKDSLAGAAGTLAALQATVGADGKMALRTRQDLEHLQARTDEVAYEAALLPQLAERVAAVDDFAKLVANNLGVIEEDVRSALMATDERRAELGRSLASLQGDLEVDRVAATKLGEKVVDLDRLVPLLAERIASMDDFAKQVSCDSQIAREDAQKLASDLTNLSRRITSVNEGVGRLANSHGELRNSVNGVLQATTADRKAVSDIGNNLAEISGLTEQVVAETTTVLRSFEAKLAASETRLADGLTNLIVRVDGADERIKTSALKLEDDLVKLSERIISVDSALATKADGKALDDIALRLADLADLSEGATGQAARELAAVVARVAALVAESVALRDQLSGLQTAVAAKVDPDALVLLERRVVDGAASKSLESFAEVGRQLSVVEASVSERLAKVTAAMEEQARHDAASMATRLNAVESELGQRLALLTTSVEAQSQESATAVAAQFDALKADVARRIVELRGAVDQQVQAALRESENTKATLARLARTEQGLSTIAGVQRGLVEALDKLQVDAKSDTDTKSVVGKQIVDIIQRMQLTDAKVSAALEDVRTKQQDVGRAVDAGQDRVASFEAELKQVQETLSQLETLGTGETGKLLAQIKDLDGRLANETKQRFAYTTKGNAAQEEFGTRLTATTAKLSEFERAIAEFTEASGKSTELTGGHIAAVTEKLADVERSVHDLAKLAERELAQAAARVEALEDAGKAEIQQVADIFAKLGEATTRIETVERTSMFDNASWYQRFNRRLQQQQIQTLEKEWTRKLSVSATKPTFGYMAARANEIERELDGRLATTVEDVILRTLVARATKGPSIEVLEIGTLFGIGAAIMFDTLKNHYEKVHFTLLDPLGGYYSDGRPDILTGQPVTERVVRCNMARAGMRDDQLRLITRLSTEQAAIEEASERLYDVLIIDADHSYAGVKTDFENFSRMVRLGGYVIFDDYGSEDWPDVKAYVDAEIPQADFLAHVGNSWRTSVYRVVKPPPAQSRGREVAAAKARARPRKMTKPPPQE